MANQDNSRAMLLDVPARKPLVPGPNSWAQTKKEQQPSSSDEQKSAGFATNRDKYEHKPMPPPPVDSSPHKKPLGATTCIQPAIPLVNPAPKLQGQQKRAVTDPVAPMPLFASRKLSVSQLRKKYSFSKAKDDSPAVEPMPIDQSSLAVRLSSEKAAEVLGLYPPSENKPDTSPASAPSASAPSLFCPSSDSLERTASPVLHAQSVPTRRYLKENDLPTPTITETPVASNRQANEDSQNRNKDTMKPDDHILLPGTLHPPRLGRYGNVGEVGLVEANGMQRVESFSGVIENAESYPGNNGQFSSGSMGVLSHSSMTQGPNTGDLLPPVMYSPSNYGGVWENDPAVGYSLPPFSPMPDRPLPSNETGRKGPSDHRGKPVMAKEFIDYDSQSNYTGFHSDPNLNTRKNAEPNTIRSSEYLYPFPSADSWVSGNSFTTTNAPLSAVLPPRWPHHQNSNCVPSPPHTQHDYERPGSMSGAMARLELTLHHHIESSAGSLSRLITDKHDRIMDQAIRRLESLEDTVSKGFRNLKLDFIDVKKDICSLREDFKHVGENRDRVEELFERIDGKLEVLEKGIEEHSCKCQLVVAERSPTGPESERRQQAASHRRSESAQGALDRSEQRQQHRSGASRSSTSARQSGNSDKNHCSNPVDGQLGNRMSNDIDTRREYFAELGAARGPVPDLRDHPAYSGMQQGEVQIYGRHDENGTPSALKGLPYKHPSLSDGRWYQQAYGQN